MVAIEQFSLNEVLLEVILAVAAMSFLLIGIFSGKMGLKLIYFSTIFLLFVLPIIGVLYFFWAVSPISDSPIPPDSIWSAFTQKDHFSISFLGFFLKVLVLWASAASLWISLDYLKKEGIAKIEYPVLILLASLGMMVMLGANNFMVLYLGLELQSLALYILAAFQRDVLRSSEAGLKYFVLGAVGSGMFLFGVTLLYGVTGSVYYTDMIQFGLDNSENILFLLAMLFVLAALAFKVSAAPFHMWTPDVYEGAPTSVTAFFGTAAKIAALGVLLLLLLGPFQALAWRWEQVILALSLISVGVGAFAGLVQSNIKRLLAYSSIGHVGYILLAMVAHARLTTNGVEGTEGTALTAIIMYLVIYVVMNLGVFACILAMRFYGQITEKIQDLAGLSQTRPFLALIIALFMFSFAGIPPLAGFFAKFYVFKAVIEAELYLPAVIAIIGSVIAAFYYLRIIKIMYFEPASQTMDSPPWSVRPVLGLSLFVTVLFVVVLGVFEGFVHNLAMSANILSFY